MTFVAENRSVMHHLMHELQSDGRQLFLRSDLCDRFEVFCSRVPADIKDHKRIGGKPQALPDFVFGRQR